MRPKSLSRLVSVACVVALTSVLAAADDWTDPPGRVARLNYVRGAVSFRPADLDDWAAANPSYPLTTGDHVWVDRDSRAEIHLGSIVARLGPETAFSLLDLDDQVAQMRISSGSLQVRLGRLDEDSVVEVDTPTGAVSLLGEGSYRIDVSDDGQDATVTVRRGEAEVTAGGASFNLRSAESADISGTDWPEYDIGEARPADEWEDWCVERDQREARSVSRRYVSVDVVGYEDLDEYGSWRDVPEYGEVWVPTRVNADWAPYREGRWEWVSPWGWTWVDDSPWGFAPFHYGRWAHLDGSWCWVPGHREVRPVYAPALVAFLGGDGWSASLSLGGGVGWFPLAPREVYVPPYSASPTYIRNVNVTNVNVTNINVTNINATGANARYANKQVAGAVTAVPAEAFVTSRPVKQVAVKVPPRAVETATVAPPQRLQPRREAASGATAAPAPKPPAAVAQRAVVARIAPPPPSRRLAGAARVEARPQPTPAVRLAVPATGEAGAKLKPKREGLPAARPATAIRPSAAHGRQPATSPGQADHRDAATPAAGVGQEPGARPRSGDAGERDRLERVRPTPRPVTEHDKERPQPATRATPPEDRGQDGSERTPPTPRPVTEHDNERPRPATRTTPPEDPRRDRLERSRPTPRPVPDHDNDRPQPAARPTPQEDGGRDRPEHTRPTPRPEPQSEHGRPARDEHPAPGAKGDGERPAPRALSTPEPGGSGEHSRTERKPTPRPRPKPGKKAEPQDESKDKGESKDKAKETPTPAP